MLVSQTALDGVVVVQSPSMRDERGEFQRLYCDRELSAVTRGRAVVQINRSRTLRVGSVRGLHLQRAPHGEIKLVRCLRGRVWDVAVDLRAGSATFLRWHAEELTSDNGRMLVIPEGCAHGFQVLEPDSELLYLHTAHYAPESEAGFHCTDPRLGIDWPLPVVGLSQRDSQLPRIGEGFEGLPA